MKECLSNGVTSFHDAGVSLNTIELYKKNLTDGKLKVRFEIHPLNKKLEGASILPAPKCKSGEQQPFLDSCHFPRIAQPFSFVMFFF